MKPGDKNQKNGIHIVQLSSAFKYLGVAIDFWLTTKENWVTLHMEKR